MWSTAQYCGMCVGLCLCMCKCVCCTFLNILTEVQASLTIWGNVSVTLINENLLGLGVCRRLRGPDTPRTQSNKHTVLEETEPEHICYLLKPLYQSLHSNAPLKDPSSHRL